MNKAIYIKELRIADGANGAFNCSNGEWRMKKRFKRK